MKKLFLVKTLSDKSSADVYATAGRTVIMVDRKSGHVQVFEDIGAFAEHIDILRNVRDDILLQEK